MNALADLAVQRLLWKEWRVLWPFAGSLLAFGLILVAMLLSWADVSGDHWAVELVVTMTPVLLLAGGIATSFSMEHENDTFLGQRLLPVSAHQIFSSKILVPSVTALLVFGVLVVAVMPFDVGAFRNFDYVTWLLVLLEMIVWCAFFSMWIKRPLVSLSVSVLCAVAVALLIGAIFRRQVQLSGPGAIELVLRGMIVVGMFIWDLRLAKEWFDDQLSDRLNDMPWRRDKISSSGEVIRRASRSGKPGVLRRMTWLFSRTRLIPVGLVATAALCCLAKYPDEFGFLMAMICSGAIGSLVFGQSSQERHVLAIHGIHPLTYWGNRLLLPSIGATLIWLFAAVSIDRMFQASALSVTAGVLASFAMGQLYSMLSRQVLMSVAASIFTAFLLCFWSILVARHVLPWTIALLPLIVFPLLITWLSATARLCDWRDRATTIRLVASVVFPVVITISAIAIYRVSQIEALNREQLASIPLATAVDREKLQRFRALGDRSITLADGPGRIAVGGIDDIITALEHDRVDISAADIELRDYFRIRSLTEGMHVGIESAISRGDSAAARKALQYQVRLHDLAFKSVPMMSSGAPSFQHCMDWASLPETTDEDIAAMVEFLTANEPDEAFARTVVAAMCTQIMRTGNCFSDPLYFDSMDFSASERTAFHVIYTFLFWERSRLQRFAKRASWQLADESKNMIQEIRRGEPDRRFSLPNAEDLPLLIHHHSFHDDYSYNTVKSAVRNSRLAIIGLRLIQHRRSTGTLPETLDELQPALGSDVLLDPYSGTQFMYLPHGLPSEWLDERLGQDLREDDFAIDYRNALIWSPTYRTQRDESVRIEETVFTLEARVVMVETPNRFSMKDLLLPKGGNTFFEYFYQYPDARSALQIPPTDPSPE